MKRVEAQQHRQGNEDFVARKIFFRLKEFVRPANLHEYRSDGAERGEEKPAAIQRHQDEAGVEDGDVAEETERIVHAGREQDRRKEAGPPGGTRCS